MADYIVFDVETPNRANRRISAIGISLVSRGGIEREFFSLCNPQTHFDYFNTKLTGIDEKTVSGAPAFPELWERIEPLMSSGILVAHNAAFDMRVLKSCLNDYGIKWKTSAEYICTVLAGRRLLPGRKHKLDDLCAYYGIDLDHHKADSDSHACAEILLRYIESGADMEQFVKKYSFTD